MSVFSKQQTIKGFFTAVLAAEEREPAKVCLHCYCDSLNEGGRTRDQQLTDGQQPAEKQTATPDFHSKCHDERRLEIGGGAADTRGGCAAPSRRLCNAAQWQDV